MHLPISHGLPQVTSSPVVWRRRGVSCTLSSMLSWPLPHPAQGAEDRVLCGHLTTATCQEDVSSVWGTSAEAGSGGPSGLVSALCQVTRPSGSRRKAFPLPCSEATCSAKEDASLRAPGRATSAGLGLAPSLLSL